MSGAASRRRGARWERQLADWFTRHNLGDIRTGRAVTGGTQQGADLVTVQPNGEPSWTVNGWVVEAKDHDRPAVAAWLNQTADNASGRPFAVIQKRRRHPPGQAWVHLPAVWAEPLLNVALPSDVRSVVVDLTVFTAALTRWEN